MIDPGTAQAVYNDMGALADLRSRARANPNEAVEDVAQQFEGLGAIAEEEFYEDTAVVVREGGAKRLRSCTWVCPHARAPMLIRARP